MRMVIFAVLSCSACAGAEIDDPTFTSGFSEATLEDGSATDSTADDTGAHDTSASASASMSSSASASSESADSTSETSSATDASATEASSDDDPSASATSSESGPPPDAVCGDGNVDAGEACDDANAIDTDACLSNCTAAICGDGVVYAGVEACDDGTNDGAYGGCNPGCAALAPYCGDGAVQGSNEHCDGATGYANVGCTNCLFDFSSITQLYCNGTCTWAGGADCDQADADIYCKLVTADSTSVATSFAIVIALDAPGFSCPSYGVDLGPLPAFGVNQSVWYQDTSILANHGSGYVVAQVVCS